MRRTGIISVVCTPDAIPMLEFEKRRAVPMLRKSNRYAHITPVVTTHTHLTAAALDAAAAVADDSHPVAASLAGRIAAELHTHP